jgi:hypothetical protein
MVAIPERKNKTNCVPIVLHQFHLLPIDHNLQRGPGNHQIRKIRKMQKRQITQRLRLRGNRLAYPLKIPWI